IQRQKAENDSGEDPQNSYYDEPSVKQPKASRDEEYDPLTQVAAEETLAERLMADLGALIDEADAPIAEYLIGSLDERGYLSTSVEAAAADLGVEPARVMQVLSHLQ